MPERIPVYFIAVVQAHALKDPLTGELYPNGSHVGLELSPNLNPLDYYTTGKEYNKNGALVFTEALIEGLLGNINVMHHQGRRDRTRHFYYIVERLAAKLNALHAPVAEQKDITLPFGPPPVQGDPDNN